MERVWDQTIEGVRSVVAAALPPLLAWWDGLGPWRWGVGVLALLLLMWGLAAASGRRRRRRRRASGARPELLFSRGEIQLLEMVDRLPGPGHAPAPRGEQAAPDDRFALSVTLSNLGDEPVQLLELAVRTDLAGTPALLERDALIPSRKSVTLEGQVIGLAGDRGWLEAYVVAGRGTALGRFGGARSRSYRLRARLAWEPWRERYRVEPLEQRVEGARALPSSQLAARDRNAWRQRQQQLRERSEASLDPEAAQAADIARAESRAAAALLARRRGFAAAGPDNGASGGRSTGGTPQAETRERVDLERFGSGVGGGLGGAVGGGPGRGRGAVPAELVIEPLRPSSSDRSAPVPAATGPDPAEAPPTVAAGRDRDSGRGRRADPAEAATDASAGPGSPAGRATPEGRVSPAGSGSPAGRVTPEGRVSPDGHSADGRSATDAIEATDATDNAPHGAAVVLDDTLDHASDVASDVDRNDVSDDASDDVSDDAPTPRRGRLEFPDEF